MPNEIKKKIELEITRENGKTYLKYKIDKNIENVFKQQASDIRESQNWPGLKFYLIPDLHESESYQDLLRSYNLYDDFGAGITAGSRMNIAWLRTVGGEGKIKIPSALTIAEISTLAKNVTSFIKAYFEGYFRNCKIKGVINVEI